MDVSIHSAIFQPLQDGDPYFVVVSALPLNLRERPPRGAQKTVTAATLDEARAKCRTLAFEIGRMLRSCGDTVRSVHLK